MSKRPERPQVAISRKIHELQVDRAREVARCMSDYDEVYTEAIAKLQSACHMHGHEWRMAATGSHMGTVLECRWCGATTLRLVEVD